MVKSYLCLLRKPRSLLVAMFALTAWLFILNTNKANALNILTDLNDVSNVLPSQGTPANPYLVVTRPGNNGMDAPQSSQDIYIPESYVVNGQIVLNLRAQDACDNTALDASGTNNDTVFVVKQSKGVTNVTTSDVGTTAGWFGDWFFICNTGTDSNITITVNAGADSTKPIPPTTIINGIKYYKIEIVASVDTSNGYYYVNRFRIIGPSDVFITYHSVIGEPFSWADYTGIAYDTNNAPSAYGFGWSTRIDFALQCNTSNLTSKQLYFYDTDYRNNTGDPWYEENPKIHWQNNSHPMYYSIEVYDRNTGNFVGYAKISGTNTDIHNISLKGPNGALNDFASGKDNTFPTPYFDVDSRYIYSAVLEDVNYTNSLQVAIPSPANQINAKDRCSAYAPHLSCTLSPDSLEAGTPYPLSGNLTITNSGANSADGSITVSISGGGSSSGSFTVAGGSTISVPGGFAMSPTTIAVPAAAGTYTVTGTITSSFAVDGPCSATVTRTAYPYLRTYGADVWAGGGFGSTCTPAQAHIYAYSSGSGTSAIGSSAQFGVTAVLNIKQFYSSSLRSELGTNIPLTGTTFSNTAGDATYGGAYGAGLCATDYYGSVSDPNNPIPFGALNRSGRQRLPITPGSNISSFTVPKGVQVVAYTTGDVTINGNIVYDSSARSSTDDIPYFVLVVKGNIRVTPNVTRLDGLYIAQPTNDSANDGRFYTCYPSGGPTQANLDSACNSQLVINGSVIAKEVKFFRTGNSVRNSVPGEKPSDFGTGTGTNAAEVINFSPELYMAPSPLYDPSSTYGPNGAGKYDAIYSLPPVF